MKNQQPLDHQLCVRQFMIAAQQETPLTLTIPSVEVMRLRADLINEELTELITLGFGDPDSQFQEPTKPNITEIADAIADLLYVVYGTAIACGIDINPVFAEVHRSNMSKFIDGHLAENGKWIKGPSYTPADIEGVLKRQ